ncbi:MAG: nucleoside triphosphate pyrophosphohydrolase [Deltaproteobacteria bacterium]|nr:nucleoside triphosphate pyrophosphohydrolase [Deltaproteobacteria bacterium]
MVDRPETERYELGDLIAILARLRAPDGCPWDREQSLASLRSYLIEEAHELLEAIDRDDAEAHREELGDLLLQIVFQSQIRAEQGRFDMRDVVDGLARKLLRRHPHVFGQEQADTPAEVVVHWERIKQQEKAGQEPASASALDSVPRSLPALLSAHRLGERAARSGFDWESAHQVLTKVHEELAELLAELEPEPSARAGEELGDLLFALANLARHLSLCSEDLLRQANRRFRERFAALERLAEERGLQLDQADADALEALWQQAKRSLAGDESR